MHLHTAYCLCHLLVAKTMTYNTQSSLLIKASISLCKLYLRVLGRQNGAMAMLVEAMSGNPTSK